MAVPTVFLSRLIGLAALILSAAMFAGKPAMLAAVQSVAQDRAALFLLGIAGIVAGLAIVLTHNVWSRGLWPLVVTLCGWVILIRGAVVLVLPADLITRIIAALDYADYFYAYAAFPLILGAYLTWRGFTPVVRQAKPAPAPAAPPKPAATPNRRPRRRR